MFSSFSISGELPPPLDESQPGAATTFISGGLTGSPIELDLAGMDVAMAYLQPGSETPNGGFVFGCGMLNPSKPPTMPPAEQLSSPLVEKTPQTKLGAKKPKKRKYLPKVLRDDKPKKRSLNPVTRKQKPQTSKAAKGKRSLGDNRCPGRKENHRDDVGTPPVVTEEASHWRKPNKARRDSVKRSLIFDMEDNTMDTGFCFPTENETPEACAEVSERCLGMSRMETSGDRSVCSLGLQGPGIFKGTASFVDASDICSPLNKTPESCTDNPETPSPTWTLSRRQMLRENLRCYAKNRDTSSAILVAEDSKCPEAKTVGNFFSAVYKRRTRLGNVDPAHNISVKFLRPKVFTFAHASSLTTSESLKKVRSILALAVGDITTRKNFSMLIQSSCTNPLGNDAYGNVLMSSPLKKRQSSCINSQKEASCRDLSCNAIVPYNNVLLPSSPKKRRSSGRKALEKPTWHGFSHNAIVPFFGSIHQNIEGPSCSHEGMQYQGQVVLFQDGGTLVPYKPPGKKKPFCPSVNLDDDTIKMWNLIMGTNQDYEQELNDTEKKKWENEMVTFQGRALAFIDRMRRFQGHRHFSKWKGSVVDSVVGVFLTQNVSDHLSSTSFLQLASRFPLQSNFTNTETDAGSFNSEIEELVVPFSKLYISPVNISEAKNQCDANFDWDSLRRDVMSRCTGNRRNPDHKDSVDWEAVRKADVKKVADAIKERGQHNLLSQRIQDFLNRLLKDHGSMDLEWLRDVEPEKAKDYLLSIRGLGIKSVECVRLLTLHHHGFPVDTNVARIVVRLGWVPLEPLPEELQLHILELYPVMANVQKYLWPRLHTLDQKTLYELHYHLITFGKVFCTKRRPNCISCPLKAECKHYASACCAKPMLTANSTSDQGLIPKPLITGPEEKANSTFDQGQGLDEPPDIPKPLVISFLEDSLDQHSYMSPVEGSCQSQMPTSTLAPVIEEPPLSPEHELPEPEYSDHDIEDFSEDEYDEIPTYVLDSNRERELFEQCMAALAQGKTNTFEKGRCSNALALISPAAGSVPMPKRRKVSRLRTVHQVYEISDSHQLLYAMNMDARDINDPSPYLLAIWGPGDTADSAEPEKTCSLGADEYCGSDKCFKCNTQREADFGVVRGTILIPCRTAVRGSFPLNGTYFQTNEVFADHQTSRNPAIVPRQWIWNLPQRTVYFGTSATSICKGLSGEEVEFLFLRGFLCCGGFDRETRAPKPLSQRLHLVLTSEAKKKKALEKEGR